MSQFQVKYFNEDDWNEISENNILRKLVEEFGLITPIVTQMVEGKEIITPEGIFRMKDHGKEGKGIFLDLEF